MINSMTGFGHAYLDDEIGVFTIEFKSINHRFLDVSLRISGNLSLMESNIRKMILKSLKRGRIEVNIRWFRKGETLPTVEINSTLLQKLYKEADSIRKQMGVQKELSITDLLSAPAVYIEIPPPIDEKKVWNALKKGVSKALSQVQRSRKTEGKRLAEELILHLNEMEDLHKKIDAMKDEVLERYRDRLSKKIDEFNQSAQSPVDRQRLDAEVLLYADKCDITEEVARLSSHIKTFKAKLESDSREAVGRSLEFLCQEMHREVNTIGSKSRDTSVSNLVLAMKNEVEKLREQVQNIE